MDAPTECNPSTFTALTSTVEGGVTFGLITCADLIYEFPTVDLINSHGVVHFVVPVAWDDSMAQMQVMGWAQGFSLAHGVNVVVSNHRTASESGSGAWSSGSTQSYVFAPSNKGDAKVMLAELPLSPASPAATGATAVSAAEVVEAAAGEAAASVSDGAWVFAAIDSSSPSVCSGEVCCRATLGDSTTEAYGSYVLGALDGDDTSEGLTWGAQVCAVLPCTKVGNLMQDKSVPDADADADAGARGHRHLLTHHSFTRRTWPTRISQANSQCLNYHTAPSTPLTELQLEMAVGDPSSAASRSVVPEIILTDASGMQALPSLFAPFVAGQPTTSGQTQWLYDPDSESAVVALNYTEAEFGLLSATIYARRFEQDSLSYDC